MRRVRTSGPVTPPSGASRGDITSEGSELNPPADAPARTRKKARQLLALIDPKPLTRQSISEKFARGLPEYATIGAASCDELVQLQGARLDSPALVLVHTRSVQMSDAWARATLDLVRSQLPEAAIVLLSDRDDVDDVVNALAYGVRGYIPTSVEAEVAFAALRLISAGGTFIPAHAFRAAVKTNGGSECTRRELMNGLDLTPRELSVIDLLREGKPNKRIAVELQMQESTVKVHVRNIMKKLRVDNRTHAASVANRLLGQPKPTTLALPPPQGLDGMTGLLPDHAETPSG